jgi:glucuronide carrier protein
LVFSFQAIFLLIYYINVAGLAAFDVGVLLLVVRLWSAVCDLLAGRLIDTRVSRRGRFRPYLLWATPPLLLASVAVFSVPAVDSYGVRLAYAWVTSAVMMLFYSLTTIPYASLASALSTDPVERVGLNSYRMGAVMLVQIVLTAVVAPQITRLGGDRAALQSFFTLTAVIFVVLGLALYWTCYRTCPERVTLPSAPVSLRATWDAVRDNRPLWVLCLSSAVLLTGQFAVVNVQAHYATLVLGDSGLLTWFALAMAATSLVMVPLASRLVGRWGVRRVYVACALVSAGGAAALALAPASVPFAVACFAVQGLGTGALNSLMYALAAECVDHGRRLTGVAVPGAVYSTYQVSRKLAQALAGGLVGWGLGLGGIPAATRPGDPAAVTALVWLTALVPAVLVVAVGLVILRFPRTAAADAHPDA